MADFSKTPATLNIADKLALFADHWNPRIISRRHMLADTTAVRGALANVYGECDR